MRKSRLRRNMVGFHCHGEIREPKRVIKGDYHRISGTRPAQKDHIFGVIQSIGNVLRKVELLNREIVGGVRLILHDEAFVGHDRVLNKYLQPDLLIIDDMGVKSLPQRACEIICEIIIRRYETRLTMT
jgi:IstB-like ATP binding protein